MSESNLHKHFPDDGKVPIPIPPADDSWNLMEQRLNEVMPVTHQTGGGHATPRPTGIMAKVLPVVKYAVASVFVSGVVLYSILRFNQPTPVPAPKKVEAGSVTDSAAGRTIDTLTSRTTGYFPVTVAGTDAGNGGAETAGTDSNNKTNTSAAGIVSEKSPAGTNNNKTNTSAAGIVSEKSPAGANNNKTNTPVGGKAAEKSSANTKNYTSAAGKSPAVNKTASAHISPATQNAGTAVTPALFHASANNRADHRKAPARASKAAAQQKDPLPSGQQPGSSLPPATSQEKNNDAAVGLADTYHPETPAVLKPGLSARLTLQPLRLPVARLAPDRPLKASSEAMDRLAVRHTPREKTFTPGYWQLMAQWSVPLPVVNSPAHYKGPNGNSQVYRLLIPGIRVQRTWSNAALSLDLNAMTTQLYRNEPYYKDMGPLGATSELRRTLLQTFGYSASLSYHHRIAGDFFGGAGVQAYYGHTAAILETLQYRDTTGIHTKETNYAEKNKIWNNIGHLQGRITGEVYYDRARWQAGVRTVVPVLHATKDSTGMNMKPAMQLELLLRWKINRKK
ncbi:hypothetical protein [Chitinophaga qingshengii]|uniref:DUF3575 domain-containing protein n=1 Tax=Chitinophaga qingshengii TaxID=1569794 RepID=A0ABR7TM10_9BACT|nr:hypothetical protein [Chitinophaga qingshengii]MBC9931020.1 hypothetical protein [Chitinophaga qingshengii]